MATPNLFRIRQINNQQTKNQNRFTLKFPGLPTVLQRAKGNAAIGDRFDAVFNSIERKDLNLDVNQTLQLSLMSVTVPNIQVETQRLWRFNDSVVATTRFTEPEDMTVTFYDYVNGSASAILFLWQALVADKRTGAMSFKEEFVLPRAELVVYGPDAPKYDPDPLTGNLPDGESEIPWVEKHEIISLFPKAVNIGEHTMDGGEARRVECTFSIDNIYPISYRSYVKQQDGTRSYTNDTTSGSVGNINVTDISSVDLINSGAN